MSALPVRCKQPGAPLHSVWISDCRKSTRAQQRGPLVHLPRL